MLWKKEAVLLSTHLSLTSSLLGPLPTRLYQIKMKTFFLLLLFCHVSSAVKHSLKFLLTGSNGVPNLPEFEAVAQVDDTEVVYCDSNKTIVEPKQEWMKQLFEKDRLHFQWYTRQCFYMQPEIFRSAIYSLKQPVKLGAVQILQKIIDCEWDDETGEVNSFMRFGYNGEDFISYDLKTLKWIALKPEAVTTRLRLDREVGYDEHITEIFPAWLTQYVNFKSKSSLPGKDLPSVSLLQKAPSSPVSCHATGFYPDSATLIWRKDGEEIHEDVDHGEILPNHDGSFQMSVDLKLSSVTPEDWRRYDCVFQLYGGKNDIVTKLDKAVIRTNEGFDPTIIIIAAVVVLALVLIAVVGFVIYKKKNDKRPPSPISNPEVMEELNPKA